MKLTVLERLIILNSLAAEGDILFLRLRNEMIDKIGLSEEEIERYGFKLNETGNASWRPDIPQEAEVELSDTQKKVIKEAILKLDRDHKLTPNHVSLYEKFVG